jgi:hypothetical protein
MRGPIGRGHRSAGFPDFAGIFEGISPKGTVAPCLKKPGSWPYDARLGRMVMFRRLALILGVIAMGLALNGCTKCGPIWDDWMQSPKSCKSDHF